jgi:hypothetical protein
MQDAALNARRQEVRNMTTVDKITVLGFRHQIGIEQLQGLSERELFVYLVDQGQIGKEGVTDSGIGQISISGNTAEGEFLLRGQVSPFKYRFVKEEGVWRIDLTALLSVVDQGLRAAISQMEVTEDEFIVRMLKLMSGKPVTGDIWEPLVEK